MGIKYEAMIAEILSHFAKLLNFEEVSIQNETICVIRQYINLIKIIDKGDKDWMLI